MINHQSLFSLNGGISCQDDLGFKITYQQGDSIALRATSTRDCQMWVEAIDAASFNCREAHKKALRRPSLA